MVIGPEPVLRSAGDDLFSAKLRAPFVFQDDLFDWEMLRLEMDPVGRGMGRLAESGPCLLAFLLFREHLQPSKLLGLAATLSGLWLMAR